MHDPYGKYPDVVGSSDIAYKAFRIYACVPKLIYIKLTLVAAFSMNNDHGPKLSGT